LKVAAPAARLRFDFARQMPARFIKLRGNWFFNGGKIEMRLLIFGIIPLSVGRIEKALPALGAAKHRNISRKARKDRQVRDQNCLGPGLGSFCVLGVTTDGRAHQCRARELCSRGLRKALLT